MTLQNSVVANMVREHFKNDTRLSNQCLDAEVCEHDVVLVGCTSSEDLKNLAEQIARGVPGVRHVENHILVKGTVKP